MTRRHDDGDHVTVWMTLFLPSGLILSRINGSICAKNNLTVSFTFHVLSSSFDLTLTSEIFTFFFCCFVMTVAGPDFTLMFLEAQRAWWRWPEFLIRCHVLPALSRCHCALFCIFFFFLIYIYSRCLRDVITFFLTLRGLDVTLVNRCNIYFFFCQFIKGGKMIWLHFIALLLL